MSNEFVEHVSELARDTALPDAIRTVANDVVDAWNRGIMPTPKQLRELGKVSFFRKAEPCTRLENDGACAWLRKHGKGNDLPVPPRGERAFCCFPNAWAKCPGYRRF